MAPTPQATTRPPQAPPDDSPRRRARRVVLLLLLVSALFGANGLYLTNLSRHYKLFNVTDFSHHGWLAGRVVLGGGSPYDSQTWLQTHWTPEYEQEIGRAYSNGQFVNVFHTRNGTLYNPQHLSDFLYPLWMAFFFSPFALLPLYWALALFMLLNELALLLALRWACRLLQFHPPWEITIVIAVLGVGFRPTFLTLQEGAYTGLVLAALLAAIGLIQQRRQPWLVGALLAFCTIKLQVTLLILVYVGCWLLIQRRRQIIGWTAFWGVCQWGLPTLLWPGWIGQWLKMTGLVNPVIFAQPTLWSLWVTYGGPYWWLIGLAVTAVLLGAFIPRWRRDFRSAQWTQLPLTFIAAVPLTYYAWEYDQVLLLFPWLACWSRAAVGDTPAARRWRLLLIAWILLLPLYALLLPVPANQIATYGLLLPATLLLLYLLAAKSKPPHRAAREPLMDGTSAQVGGTAGG
ncbi:MAG: DUF2029 domain-containing protein [Chloroflexota bacterium]|nr:DUF2029 domain-containing protein [Chloroflexota bacterium]